MIVFLVLQVGERLEAGFLELAQPLVERELGQVAVKNLLPIQPGDVPATWANVDNLTRDVGFKPATSIAEGVKRFVGWYREFYRA